MRRITNLKLDLFYTPDYLSERKVDPLPIRLEISKIETKYYNPNTKEFDETEKIVPVGLQINSKGYFVNMLSEEVTTAIFESLKKSVDLSTIRFDVEDELRIYELTDDIPQLHEKIILETLYKSPDLISDADLPILNINALYLPPKEFAQAVITAEMFAIDSHPRAISTDKDIAVTLNKTLFKLSPSEELDYKYTGQNTEEISQLLNSLNSLETPNYFKERKNIASTIDLSDRSATVSGFIISTSIEQDLHALTDFRELSATVKHIIQRYPLNKDRPLKEQFRELSTADRNALIRLLTPENQQPSTIIRAYSNLPLTKLEKFLTDYNIETFASKTNINVGNKIKLMTIEEPTAISINEPQAEQILETQLSERKYDNDFGL